MHLTKQSCWQAPCGSCGANRNVFPARRCSCSSQAMYTSLRQRCSKQPPGNDRPPRIATTLALPAEVALRAAAYAPGMPAAKPCQQPLTESRAGGGDGGRGANWGSCGGSRLPQGGNDDDFDDDDHIDHYNASEDETSKDGFRRYDLGLLPVLSETAGLARLRL